MTNRLQQHLYSHSTPDRNMTTGRLHGCNAVVTGSSRGIGAAIASAFAEEGARVVINCDKSETQAREVVESIHNKNGSSVLCLADVRRYDDCVRLVGTAEKEFGGLDILVNNAGVTKDDFVHKLNLEDWQEVLAVNLTGVLNCTRAASSALRNSKRGVVINISSVVGQMGNIGQSSYTASKAGVIGLTKTLAREFARYGIRVNAIAPGFCDTEMVRRIPKQVLDKILPQIPLNRLGSPRDIASTAVFLASEDARYITGQIISVNGGLYM